MVLVPAMSGLAEVLGGPLAFAMVRSLARKGDGEWSDEDRGPDWAAVMQVAGWNGQSMGVGETGV